MRYKNNITMVNELSAAERVFTTAQAERLGVSRNALAHAHKTGRLLRITHGAYRLSGVPSSETDELAALWKLTAPTAFSWERQSKWDGIAIGGSTAACILGIGDFYLSPYRIYAPKRINSRKAGTSFGVRKIDKEDIVWRNDLPVTRPERTLVDLCLDHEDPSLIENTLQDAVRQNIIDLSRLDALLASTCKSKHHVALFAPLGKGYSPTKKESSREIQNTSSTSIWNPEKLEWEPI